MSEKATVIIPLCNLYNRPEWLSESIISVLEQTYPNIEIIVVGHFSTNDRFKDVLNQYKDNIVYCETKDISPGLMMNEALKIATGEFITRLDEGDLFLNGNIEKQVKAFVENPNTGLILTAHQLIDEYGSDQNIVYIPKFTHKAVLCLLLYGHSFGRSAAMIRRKCYQDVGQYNDSSAAENDMRIRVVRHYRVGIMNEPLVKQRNHPINDQLKESIHVDTQRTVSDALASIPLEELFPKLQSDSDNPIIKSCAYDVRGIILMENKLYAEAEYNFAKALQLYSDASVHQMWMGILSRRIKDYQKALNHFKKIPPDDRFYFDAQWAIVLTSETQKASTNVRDKLQDELANEYNTFLKITLDSAKGKLDEMVSPPSDIAEEAWTYLNWDISQVLNAVFKGTEMMKDEWNSRSPQNPDDIVDFYKETENYIFELAWWHRGLERKHLTATTIKICERNDSKKILDFGCGIGQDGISLAEAGFDVTLADLPGKTFDFAKWRVKRKGLKVGLVNSDELNEKYDTILCFDVLEHLWEPNQMVEYLRDHLTDNGILFITAHFEHTDARPMHLEKNDKYSGNEFLKMMEQAGFRMVPWGGIPLVFQVRRNGRQAEKVRG